jgi:hypothetical protein
MSFILCCQGLFFIGGFAIFIYGPFQLWGRSVGGSRHTVLGLLWIAQAPCAILVSGLLLGDTAPGDLNNVPWEEALPRLAALMSEWAILLSALLMGLLMILTSPRSDRLEATQNPAKE